MQKFEMPKLSVEEFEIVDVVMTSLIEGEENTNSENELPDQWD